MQSDVPCWWRPFWVAATMALVTLLMIDDDYSLLISSLAALCAACFGFEYLAQQHRDEPPD